jgi:hypothetical protein
VIRLAGHSRLTVIIARGVRRRRVTILSVPIVGDNTKIALLIGARQWNSPHHFKTLFPDSPRPATQRSASPRAATTRGNSTSGESRLSTKGAPPFPGREPGRTAQTRRRTRSPGEQLPCKEINRNRAREKYRCGWEQIDGLSENDNELHDLAADASSCLWPSEPGIPVDPSVARLTWVFVRRRG